MRYSNWNTRALATAGVILAISISGLPARASTVTFDFGSKFSGTGVPNTNPFATVTIKDSASLPNVVTATISVSPLLSGGLFIDSLYLNYGTTKDDVSAIGGSSVAGDNFGAGSVSVPEFNKFKADGVGGWYDIKVEFAQSGDNRLTAGESETITFTPATSKVISALLFNSSSFQKNGGDLSFLAALHLQGFGGGISGWFSPCPGECEGFPPPGVPLPPAVWLFGTALLGLTTLGRRRRMKPGVHN